MMAKLDYLQAKNLNPADELRAELAHLENLLPQLSRLSSEQAEAVLVGLDRAEALLTTLEASGTGVIPELGRFSVIQARVKKQAGPILRALGGSITLAARRPTPAPANQTRWWWYLDGEVTARQRQSRRRAALLAGVGLVVLVGAYLLYNTLLAPSPAALARYEAENRAMETLADGDYRAGLAEVEKGLAANPGDAGLLIYRGVLAELAADPETAAQSFAQAQVNLSSPLDFYIARARAYLSGNRLVSAEADARAAIKLDGQSAVAWLLLGQALESQDQRQEAAAAYRQAGELAMAGGNSEIVVMSRMALARLSGVVP